MGSQAPCENPRQTLKCLVVRWPFGTVQVSLGWWLSRKRLLNPVKVEPTWQVGVEDGILIGWFGREQAAFREGLVKVTWNQASPQARDFPTICRQLLFYLEPSNAIFLLILSDPLGSGPACSYSWKSPVIPASPRI